jgi:ACR3 family arsenite transporter
MMLKVDFQSIKNVGKNPKGLFVTWVTNWLIKPFTMFGIAWLFFFVIFKSLIPADLAKDYLAGAILLGAAPCTAMVFVWSHLTKGNRVFRVQVATNDLSTLCLLHPSLRALGIRGVKIWDTLDGPSRCCGRSLAGDVITPHQQPQKRAWSILKKAFSPIGNVTIAGCC